MPTVAPEIGDYIAIDGDTYVVIDTLDGYPNLITVIDPTTTIVRIVHWSNVYRYSTFKGIPLNHRNRHYLVLNTPKVIIDLKKQELVPMSYCDYEEIHKLADMHRLLLGVPK